MSSQYQARRAALRKYHEDLRNSKTVFTRLKIDAYQITYLVVEKLADRSVLKYKVSHFIHSTFEYNQYRVIQWYGTVDGKVGYTLETIGIKVFAHENGSLLVIIPYNSEPCSVRISRHSRFLYRIFPPRNCNNGETIQVSFLLLFTDNI